MRKLPDPTLGPPGVWVILFSITLMFMPASLFLPDPALIVMDPLPPWPTDMPSENFMDADSSLRASSDSKNMCIPLQSLTDKILSGFVIPMDQIVPRRFPRNE